MGEEIVFFENDRISDFQGLATTLDRVILHTVMHHSSTSTYIPNRRNFLWTDGRTFGLYLVCSTGLIENSLFVGVIYHESCHSSMHSLNICQKKLSGGILLSVMTEQIPSLAALSAISFPFIPTWLGIQHRLACLPISVSWV